MQETKSELASFLEPIKQLEAIVASWDDTHRQTVHALRESIDQLHKEAFSRLIVDLKTDPSIQTALREAVSDEVVYAVLRHLGVVRPSLNERVEAALSSVRPFLETHGGNVELVTVEPPDTVEIRLLGTCDGCPSSNLTLSEGVKKAIKEHCPEIKNIHKVKGFSQQPKSNGVPLHFISPFAKAEDRGWLFAVNTEDIPEDGILVKELKGHSLLFSRQGHQIACFENACAHMGMSLEMGHINDGIITCPYHSFQYSLTTGECLTAPEVQLQTHAIRVTGAKVEVKITE